MTENPSPASVDNTASIAPFVNSEKIKTEAKRTNCSNNCETDGKTAFSVPI